MQEISAGRVHFYARLEDGSAKCWGYGDSAASAVATNSDAAMRPAERTVQVVSAGGTYTFGFRF